MNAPDAEAVASVHWVDEMLLKVFRSMHSFEQDNFDASRFRGVSPATFFFEKHARYLSLYMRHGAEFYRARNLLVDDVSRGLFDSLVLFRILGHLHVRLPFDRDTNERALRKSADWKVGETDDEGLLGLLARYDVPTDAGPIRMKGWPENVAATFLLGHYNFYRERHAIAPRSGHHVIDAGGCFGDTALGFAHTVGPKGRVYTFDPVIKHCAIMRDVFAMNPTLAPRIRLFPVGLSNEHRSGAGEVDAGDVINPGATIFAGDLPTETLDGLAGEGTLERIDFIKMDIEGSELAALQGGEAVLRRWKPDLAISLYHRPDDFFRIPLWIDGLGCGYRFFLDHYSMHEEETVLYATARGE